MRMCRGEFYFSTLLSYSLNIHTDIQDCKLFFTFHAFPINVIHKKIQEFQVNSGDFGVL